MLITALVIALLVGLASALALHELGHACSALLLGGRVERVEWRGLSARVVAVLPSRHAQALFLLAGSCANLVVAALACALAFAGRSSTIVPAMALFAGIHLLQAAFALVPTGTSDGARLLELVRATGAAARGGARFRADRGES